MSPAVSSASCENSYAPPGSLVSPIPRLSNTTTSRPCASASTNCGDHRSMVAVEPMIISSGVESAAAPNGPMVR